MNILKICLALAFSFAVINPVLADDASCKNIDHYLSDFQNPSYLTYIQISDPEDAAAVLETLTALGMAPPGKPEHYLFLTSASNRAATVIAIFDGSGCFIANAGMPVSRATMILQMTFPNREMPVQRPA